MAMDKVGMNDEMMDQVTGGSSIAYSVQPGDSLNVIAKKFNVTTEQLVQWNNIKNPDLISIGQRLTIYARAIR